MKRVTSNFYKSIELDGAIQEILDNLPLKITLFALYGIVWIWGLIGNFSCFKIYIIRTTKGKFPGLFSNKSHIFNFSLFKHTK